jgi:hypothetical protein
MATLGPVDRHFWLNQGMARTIGVNLSEALAEGDLDVAGYCALIDRCRNSTCGEACVAWMGEQGAGARCAPDFCANAATLNALRARQRRG